MNQAAREQFINLVAYEYMTQLVGNLNAGQTARLLVWWKNKPCLCQADLGNITLTFRDSLFSISWQSSSYNQAWLETANNWKVCIGKSVATMNLTTCGHEITKAVQTYQRSYDCAGVPLPDESGYVWHYEIEYFIKERG